MFLKVEKKGEKKPGLVDRIINGMKVYYKKPYTVGISKEVVDNDRNFLFSSFHHFTGLPKLHSFFSPIVTGT